MQLSEETLRLVRAVADNDLTEARQAAEALLVDDRTRKNRGAVSDLMTRLHAVPEECPRVPDELSDILRLYEPALYMVPLTGRRGQVLNELGLDGDSSPEETRNALSLRPLLLRPGPSRYFPPSIGICLDICRWVSYRTGLPLVVLHFPTLIALRQGSAARAVPQIFQFYRDTPCILLIEAIDNESLFRYNFSSWQNPDSRKRALISLWHELRDMYCLRNNNALRSDDKHILIATVEGASDFDDSSLDDVLCFFKKIPVAQHDEPLQGLNTEPARSPAEGNSVRDVVEFY